MCIGPCSSSRRYGSGKVYSHGCEGKLHPGQFNGVNGGWTLLLFHGLASVRACASIFAFLHERPCTDLLRILVRHERDSSSAHGFPMIDLHELSGFCICSNFLACIFCSEFTDILAARIFYLLFPSSLIHRRNIARSI
jgi:hypothetical protein